MTNTPPDRLKDPIERLQVERKITQGTIRHFGVRAVVHRDLSVDPVLEFPYRRGGIEYASKRLKDGNTRSWATPRIKRDLFNIDVLDRPDLRGKPIILASSEIAVLNFHECGFERVVGLPDDDLRPHHPEDARRLMEVIGRLSAAKSPILVALPQQSATYLGRLVALICKGAEVRTFWWSGRRDAALLAERIANAKSVEPKTALQAWRGREAQLDGWDAIIEPLTFKLADDPFEAAQGKGSVEVMIGGERRRVNGGVKEDGEVYTSADITLHLGSSGDPTASNAGIVAKHPDDGAPCWVSIGLEVTGRQTMLLYSVETGSLTGNFHRPTPGGLVWCNGWANSRKNTLPAEQTLTLAWKAAPLPLYTAPTPPAPQTDTRPLLERPLGVAAPDRDAPRQQLEPPRRGFWQSLVAMFS